MAIDHYVFDATLKRNWKIVVDCANPQRPGVITEADISEQASGHTGEPSPRTVAIAVIRAGSTVELWQKGNAEIKLKGIALESASIGQPILVRAGLGATPLRGIVRGAGSVELVGVKDALWGQQ